ncbi:MAG: ribonuclease J [Acutalibacteraceae bacterium]|nr:ribonuclease J [Acutalibacteraceae bacterium]
MTQKNDETKRSRKQSNEKTKNQSIRNSGKAKSNQPKKKETKKEAAYGRINPPETKKSQKKNEKTSKPETKKRQYSKSGKNSKDKKKASVPVRVIPLGGLEEIGKNITLYECGDDMILVDCGMAFPDDDLPGIDLVIPDFTYVIKNKDKIRGLFITHGHEDHIGSIPYLLKEFDLPVYGTRLTLGLVEGKLKEHGIKGDLRVCSPTDRVKAGCFDVEFIHVNHSIPDSVGFAIRCPGGLFVHTGDFKIDTTPIDGDVIDLARFGELGAEGVTMLLTDSTNAEREGFTPSERTVGNSFENLFSQAQNKRIIVATFSSNIHRIQQIIDEAVRCSRKVAVSGRSMINVVSVASELGYLNVPEGVLIDIDSIRKYPPENIVIITTGSQGEPMSALHRMAFSDHRKVDVGPGDLIIISATPIPGNEKTVSRVVNELMKLGAEVIYERMYYVHVSGHACAEEIKLIHTLTKPKYYMPLHGEYKHLVKNAKIAESLGTDKKNIVIAQIGNVVEVTENNVKIVNTVPAGRMLVDGYGVGDVGNIVLKDRKHLAEDGLIAVVMTIDGVSGDILAGPDIVTRGFVYVREAEELIIDAKRVVCNVLDSYQGRDWSTIKQKVRDDLSRYLYERTKRSPMILPIIMEI